MVPVKKKKKKKKKILIYTDHEHHLLHQLFQLQPLEANDLWTSCKINIAEMICGPEIT